MSTTAPAAPASPPPPTSTGTWIRAQLHLADGSTLEIRIPGCRSAGVSTYEPQPGEEPSIIRVDLGGKRQRGKLTQLLGGGQ